MRAKLLLLPLGAALVCLTACDIEDFGQRYQRDFHYSYPLKPGGSISVESFNGSVEISGWDQDAVDVSGTKYGPTPETADSLRIDVQNSPGEVAIRAVRPSDGRGSEGARFVIKVPRGATLDRIATSNASIRTADGKGPARLKTTNGSIHVQDLAGGLEATTSNGAIVAELGASAGPVRLETSNGSVDLTLPQNFSSDAHVNSSNGPITLRLPGDPSARLAAHTSNGSITSDFEMRMQGGAGKNQLEGTLGAGDGLLDLGTSNGSIRLLKM